MAAFILSICGTIFVLLYSCIICPRGNKLVFGLPNATILLLNLLVVVLLLVISLSLGRGNFSLKDARVSNRDVCFLRLPDISEMESYHSYSPPEERRSRQSDLSSHSSNERDNPRYSRIDGLDFPSVWLDGLN